MGITFTYIGEPDKRKPTRCHRRADGKAQHDSGNHDFPAAMAGAGDQHWCFESDAGSIRVHCLARAHARFMWCRLLAKLRPSPLFLSVSSDLYNNTPNVNIDIRRDQAKTYGVSEARILTLLRNAYSQNYLYLIKQPDDQYQVILEMDDSVRENPEDMSLLYIKSDDGARLVPLSELVTWKDSWSTVSEPLQSVHEHDALFQPQAGVASEMRRTLLLAVARSGPAGCSC